MTTDTGGVQGGAPLQWGQKTDNDDATRTTKTATFSTGGREYKVTVSYSRQAVMDKYGVEDDAVDTTMEQVIARIGKAQLSKLSGHSISTSLSDPTAKARFKKIDEADYQEMPDVIPTDGTGDLFRTINSVRSIFAQTLGQIRGGGTLDLEVDELDEVEGLGEGREIRFKEQHDGNPLLEVAEEGELQAAVLISDKLPPGHPLKTDEFGLEKLVLIIRANALDFNGEDQDEYESYKQQIGSMIKDMGYWQQQNVLSNLDDKSLATDIFTTLNQSFQFASIKHELPESHPLAEGHDDDLRLLVKVNLSLNNSQSDIQAILIMLRRDDPALTKTQQNDMLNRLKDQYLADDLRVQLGLQKPTDIIAGVSQGKYFLEGQPEGVGRCACASICAQAIYHLAANDGKIQSPGILYDFMHRGIVNHLQGTEQGEIPGPKNFADEVFPGLNSALSRNETGITLLHEDIETATMANFKSDEFVVVTAAPRSGEGAAETILLFRQDDKYCVFDSHGTSFEGVPRGASVRQFNSSDDLKAYVDGKYPDLTHAVSAEKLTRVIDL